MRKQYHFFYFILICYFIFQPLLLHAERVSKEKAEQVAKIQLGKMSHSRLQKQLNLQYTHKKAVEEVSLRNGNGEEIPVYYVFGINKNDGFIIVSGDDVTMPVLAYSNSGTYDVANLPPNFRYWMESLSQQIEKTVINNLPQSTEIATLWHEYYSNNMTVSTANVVVAPLLQTQWNQNAPYNSLCPMDDGYRSSTGCVPTAMAQIMKYWEHPTARTATIPGYTTGQKGLSIPAITGSTTYDWANMRNSSSEYTTDEQNNAVATLMYECGVSLRTNYTSWESGAADPYEEFVNFFNYDASIQYRSRSNYTNAEWNTLLKNELDAARPIFYNGGSPASSAAHAFVCDGYDNEGYFHFNWGWSGSMDGYFSIAFLDGMETGQSILINIKPASKLTDDSGICGANITYVYTAADSTLTINGTGAMTNYTEAEYVYWQDYTGVSLTPWHSYRSAIKKIIINNGVTSIGDYAFYGCTSLTSISIPGSIGQIGNYALSACICLTSITIPENVSYIGGFPLFNKCESLETINVAVSNAHYTSVDGVLFNKQKTTLIRYPRGKTGAYTIPDNVTSIRGSAFEQCFGLTSIILPNTLVSIGDQAFTNCYKLESVTSDGLASETIPQGINLIEQSAFFGCISLSYVTIPFGVTTIENTSFYGCTALTSIVIPNSVTSINDLAFAVCRSLASITIGSGVTTIGNFAFAECNDLQSITSYAINPPDIFDNTFDNVPINISVSVPCQSVSAYQTTADWSEFTNYTDCVTGMNEVLISEDLLIYPNPIADVLYIQAEYPVEYIDILDVTGHKIVNSLRVTQNNAVDVSALTSGVYLVRVGNKLRKVIKK